MLAQPLSAEYSVAARTLAGQLHAALDSLREERGDTSHPFRGCDAEFGCTVSAYGAAGAVVAPSHNAYEPVEGATALITALLEHYRLPAHVFEWSESSDNASPGHHGGGAVLCRAGSPPQYQPTSVTASELLASVTDAPLAPAPDAPAP